MQISPSAFLKTQAIPASLEPWPVAARVDRYRPVKRGIDLVLGLLMAPLCILLVGLLWALVRLDGGPGFFGHVRVGRHGRAFRCWKIRTMVPDADRALARVLQSDPEVAAQWAAERKLRRDPRITRIGRFLRRSSLDELPQLLNVLRGDMSLVGPRPVTFEEIDLYGASRGAYLSVRPGLTGLWQVSGRNSLSYEARVSLDERYVTTMGLLTDVRILARTLGVVFRRTGV
jgi:lipopolysaccharide/colanic/teichoic acid biosynthesis glycosyltransferase